MQLASALTVSSDPKDIAELATAVVFGVAIAVLAVSGVRARRRTKGAGKAVAKGNLRLVAAGALLVLLGLSIFGPLPSDDEDPDPSAAATPSATVSTRSASGACTGIS